MARTRVSVADTYRAHAVEARSAKAAARTDAARTHFDYAAGYFETAARLMDRVPKLSLTAAAHRSAAASATKRRRPDLASQFMAHAARQETAASASPLHAEKFHAMGMERNAIARKCEAEAPTAAQLVDQAAARVAALNPVAQPRRAAKE